MRDGATTSEHSICYENQREKNLDGDNGRTLRSILKSSAKFALGTPFTCEGGVVSDDLQNCAGDYQTKEKCTYGECGDPDKGVSAMGTIEGGMGYWPSYTI